MKDRRNLDRIDTLWWGSVLIWGALVMILANIRWPGSAPWWDGWGVFFAGIGLLALIGAAIRLQMPRYRSKWLLSLIFGAVFLAIGLGAWGTAWWLWALILLVAGGVTLRSVLAE